MTFACCKKHREMPDYEPAFTRAMEFYGICRIDGVYKHLECMCKEPVKKEYLGLGE